MADFIVGLYSNDDRGVSKYKVRDKNYQMFQLKFLLGTGFASKILFSQKLCFSFKFAPT